MSLDVLWAYLLLASLFLLLAQHTTTALAPYDRSRNCQNRNYLYDPVVSRHEIFRKLSAAIAIIPSFGLAEGNEKYAYAFDNRVSDQYKDRPKQRGSKPNNLGVAKRSDMLGNEYIGLKPCGPAPNCFVSTTNPQEGKDEDLGLDAEHSIPPWKWPLSMNKQQAFEDLVSTLKMYPPGQSNVDGGGFQFVTNDPNAGFVYMQFESLKNGYIDDVEFAFLDGALQVRSSSRLGYLDFGVNAKRLNYIAKLLRENGWDAPGVDYKTHQNYVIQNQLTID
jgi:uncharacterized protein (DUF1499 family)